MGRLCVLITLMGLLVAAVEAVGAVAVAVDRRPYLAISPDQFATTKRTHVCVTGRVDHVTRQADGDHHVRVTASGMSVVAEIIPRIPLPIPAIGKSVTVCGIRRFDDAHGWWEVHPVEFFK